MDNRIKVAIIDDEQLIVEGIKLLLSRDKNMVIEITSCDGEDFIAKLSMALPNDFPDIALIDIQMEPMNGFNLVEILREKHPQLKIIVLSSHYKSSILGYMIKLGISAFLSKNSSKEKFIEVIRAVHENGIFFSPEDHQMLLTYMNSTSKKKTLFNIQDELSEREKDVVKLICQQHTNHEIAEKLFLSQRTIESHRQRVLDKIGAKNTVGIVIYAILNDIYTLPIKL